MTSIRKVPCSITDEVVRLDLEGSSKEQIEDTIGLPENKVSDILHELDLPENWDLMIYQLAVKLGKNGQDVKDFPKLIEAKNVLVQHGVNPTDALPFLADLTLFCETTGLGTDDLLCSLPLFHKFARSTGGSTFENLKNKTRLEISSLPGLEEDVKALQKKLDSLKLNA